MNQSTPVSLDKKVNFLIQKIQSLFHQITDKEKQHKNENLLTFKLRYITFIDDSIQKIQSIYDSEKFYNLINSSRYENEGNLSRRTQPNLAGYGSTSEQYFSIQKQKLDLEKKLIEYRLNQVKKQQNQIQTEKHILSLQREKKQIQNLNQKLVQKNRNITIQIEYMDQKITSQDKQIERLVFLNQKQNQQINKVKEERNKAERLALQLRERLQYEQSQAILPVNTRSQKINIKNTQGLKCVRMFTNLTNQKKNHERYVVLELPIKMQIQKIVYAVRLGIVLSNKEIVYFNDAFMYQKDTMNIGLQGQYLVVQYVKRKERKVLDQYKMSKPQILVMLYGKGDSVMIYE